MNRLCSHEHCTRTATRVPVFDAAGPSDDGRIRIRAEAYACNAHREHLAAQVHAHAETDADLIA